MIAVTGATGQLGSQIVAHLAKQINPSTIVAIVRNEEKASNLKELGVQIRVADYHDTEALNKALEGVSKIMLVSSSDFKRSITTTQKRSRRSKKCRGYHM